MAWCFDCFVTHSPWLPFWRFWRSFCGTVFSQSFGPRPSPEDVVPGVLLLLLLLRFAVGVVAPGPKLVRNCGFAKLRPKTEPRRFCFRCFVVFVVDVIDVCFCPGRSWAETCMFCAPSQIFATFSAQTVQYIVEKIRFPRKPFNTSCQKIDFCANRPIHCRKNTCLRRFSA